MEVKIKEIKGRGGKGNQDLARIPDTLQKIDFKVSFSNTWTLTSTVKAANNHM